MFVKSAWNTYKGKRYQRFYLAESYRHPETGTVRHRHLLNLTPLPRHAIDAVARALREGPTEANGSGEVRAGDLKLKAGDSLRGAGVLAIWRWWRLERMEGVLAGCTPAQRQSVFAMVAQRILQPGSKLSLKEYLADTAFARLFSAKRLDEDELYEVMDVLHRDFYEVQKRLYARREQGPFLCLYDLTSTYFEGTEAQGGEYGHSRDKRWDRYQIVIGLVCDEAGVPLAIEVWPGNTADKTTVVERILYLKDRFKIDTAVFVGDAGMYTQTNVEALENAGFDYILRVDWQTQRSQLEALAPQQLDLFDQYGVVEWMEEGARYVGCLSEAKRERARYRREKGMAKAREELADLAVTAAKGKYYSWTRLREKVNEILDAAGVKDLWRVDIAYLGKDPGSPEKKARLKMSYTPDEQAIERRALLEGLYVLRTSLAACRHDAKKVDKEYRRLQVAERTFRHIKSYLKIRPVYHRLDRRIRAHVLICFLAYYLVKKMELAMRAAGESREVEAVLRLWDRLKLTEVAVEAGKYRQREWQWSLGTLGSKIREEIEKLGWWRSLDAQFRSLSKQLAP